MRAGPLDGRVEVHHAAEVGSVVGQRLGVRPRARVGLDTGFSLRPPLILVERETRGRSDGAGFVHL